MARWSQVTAWEAEGLRALLPALRGWLRNAPGRAAVPPELGDAQVDPWTPDTLDQQLLYWFVCTTIYTGSGLASCGTSRGSAAETRLVELPAKGTRWKSSALLAYFLLLLHYLHPLSYP